MRETFLNYLRQSPLLGRYALKAIPNIERKVNIAPIGEFTIRLRQHRSYWLRHPLTHEQFMLGALHRLIRRDDVVYDVGSNIGLYIRFMAYFGAGQIIGFEPMKGNHTLLAKNISLSKKADQIRVIHKALGETNGEENLQIDDMMSLSAVLDSVTKGKASQGRLQYGLPPLTERVQVATLDSLLKSEKLPPPQLIKIDIEGAEAMMLRGARQLLQIHAPRLLIEMHDLDVAREVLQLLAECGYSCFGYVGGTDGVYKQIKADDTLEFNSYHEMHHIVASVDPEEICEPIALFPLSSPYPA